MKDHANEPSMLPAPDMRHRDAVMIASLLHLMSHYTARDENDRPCAPGLGDRAPPVRPRAPARARPGAARHLRTIVRKMGRPGRRRHAAPGGQARLHRTHHARQPPRARSRVGCSARLGWMIIVCVCAAHAPVVGGQIIRQGHEAGFEWQRDHPARRQSPIAIAAWVRGALRGPAHPTMASARGACISRVGAPCAHALVVSSKIIRPGHDHLRQNRRSPRKVLIAECTIASTLPSRSYCCLSSAASLPPAAASAR